eukprot:1142522-Pelagomonas_calceolata.AAC.3
MELVNPTHSGCMARRTPPPKGACENASSARPGACLYFSSNEVFKQLVLTKASNHVRLQQRGIER